MEFTKGIWYLMDRNEQSYSKLSLSQTKEMVPSFQTTDPP